MPKAVSKASEPKILTVGDLIGVLCRWPDNAAVAFRCPLHDQELRFFRIQCRTAGVVDIELGVVPA